MKTEYPRVDIVTVNYNGRVYLTEYFRALEQLDYPKEKLRLFFVDNASKDGSVECARRFNPGFTVAIVENPRNLGFARANNLMLRNCGAPFIALLNNDTKVEKDWLSGLTAKMQSDQMIGIVSSRQVPQESSRLIDAITQETSWCSGGHCVIRRSALEGVGFFDEGFFMYGEDVDLSWRMWLAGYKCVYVPEAVCQHHYDDTSLYGVRRLYYHVRNSILLRYIYGRGEEIRKEIWRWVKEGLASGLKRRSFARAYAILAGVTGHFFCAGYFLRKGRDLKANPRFNEMRRRWITL